MWDIFTAATRALAWLGDETERSTLAFEFISEMYKVVKERKLEES
jgi:hypothetical protein